MDKKKLEVILMIGMIGSGVKMLKPHGMRLLHEI